MSHLIERHWQKLGGRGGGITPPAGHNKKNFCSKTTIEILPLLKGVIFTIPRILKYNTVASRHKMVSLGKI